MKTDELREKYLAFFETKGHTRCPSDVLVPTWDPSVLFTPAGMNQFKDHFLGKVHLDFTRATTCQKCMRTGDIDNVGRTPRHHTFFEMLGNFSFGDYFKRDAINWAWEFLTADKWLGIDPAQLSVTVYKDDSEAAEIWKKDIGLPDSRIQWLDEDENFWPASAPSEGPDGVCGPCSEIYFHPTDGREEVEIWNLVFTQFNREGDPPNNLTPLPSKNIDTGMGLERIAAAMQGVVTNFHIDTIMPIVEAAADVCNVPYEYDSENGRRLRRITDHIRACTFCVHENVYPGANKEKYVVKRLLRRAVLDGHQIGQREPFLHKIVPAVVDCMKTPYPELSETVERVSSVIRSEEANFFSTIDAGLERIHRVFDEMKASNRSSVDGAIAAEFYQTFGIPPELFEALAAERDYVFDWDAYKQRMEKHREDTGSVTHGVMGSAGPMDELKEELRQTEFLGYDMTETTATVKGIVAGEAPDDSKVESAATGDQTLRVILDRTPFYGESGGQVGDSGVLKTDSATFTVDKTEKDGSLIVHFGRVTQGTLKLGEEVTATVDTDRRDGIRRAHSATHMLHWALQKNLGSHAQQQGSKVDDDWLRFDFTNLDPVAAEALQTVESDVRSCVSTSDPIKWETLPLADAREAGAMMLFGEKYPDPVRMVSMGDFSKELCGGTHLTNTSDVEQFEIIGEEGVAAGTRRVTALTGKRAEAHREQTQTALTEAAKQLDVVPSLVPQAALALAERARWVKKLAAGGKAPEPKVSLPKAGDTDLDYVEMRKLLRETARNLNVQAFDVPDRIQAMQSEIVSLEKQIAAREEAGGASADDLIAAAKQIGGTNVIIAELPMAGSELMRQLVDQIRKKVEPTAILFASRDGESKVTLIAAISRDLTKTVSAGNWVKEVAPVVGGGGGGKPDMAQAGGKNPDKTPDALQKAEEWITAALGA